MSDMERRAAEYALKQFAQNADETRGMVVALAAIIASTPEFKAIDLEKAKELARQMSNDHSLSRGRASMFDVLKAVQAKPS